VANTHRAKPKASRRAIRPIKINAVLLAVALSPLIFGLCSNIVTGGSFSSAFQEKNLWVYPFLATSGIIYIISNYKEAEKAAEDSGQISSEKLGEQIIEARAIAVKAVRRALASAASSVRSDGAFKESPKTDDYEEPAETLLTLIDDIFNEDRRRPRSSAISAAWRLASLMGKDYIRESVAEHTLTQKQLDQPRLTWFIRPGSRLVGPENSLNTIEGRIGYLIREGGIDRIPNSLIALDPYLAAALIAVRESNPPTTPHVNLRYTIMKFMAVMLKP
jgi:hypothetical protein